MASTTIDEASNTYASSPSSLKERLTAALPSGFSCKVRYIRSLPKASEPLFSALPGKAPEKTRQASHFLTVSADPASLLQYNSNAISGAGSDVISFAIEVFVYYSSKRLTTIFVSKVDSTPYILRVKPSPVKTTVTTFLQWLSDEEIRRRPRRKVVISLFARAQAQYLFPGSADDKTKHVLDDRQLIKWWARTLDPIIPRTGVATIEDEEVKYQGYLTVPGCTGSELKSFMPPAITHQPLWLPGNPLIDLAKTRGFPEHAPPRCLLPRFPDDPKARFMQDLDDEIGLAQESQVHISPSKKKSGRWKSVTDLERFWEMMAFRQECLSGRAVGFLWLVISTQGCDMAEQSFTSNDAESQESLSNIPSSDVLSRPEIESSIRASPRKRRRKQLSGPVIPRQPRLKGGSSGLSSLSEMETQAHGPHGDGVVVSKDGYEAATHTMLNLDFSTLEIAIRSSSKWIAEVTSIAGRSSDFGMVIKGTAPAETAMSLPAAGTRDVVNDLGGTIRKKRKAGDGTGIPPESTEEAIPSVNVLAGATIRKKPKPAA